MDNMWPAFQFDGWIRVESGPSALAEVKACVSEIAIVVLLGQGEDAVHRVEHDSQRLGISQG